MSQSTELHVLESDCCPQLYSTPPVISLVRGHSLMQVCSRNDTMTQRTTAMLVQTPTQTRQVVCNDVYAISTPVRVKTITALFW